MVQKIDTKVSIICPIHGEFNQTPRNHKNGHGCPDCGNISRSKSSAKNIEYFISKSNLIHSDKYDYSKSIYIKYNKFVQEQIDQILQSLKK